MRDEFIAIFDNASNTILRYYPIYSILNMKKIKTLASIQILILILFFYHASLQAQISIKIDNAPNATFYLQQIKGDRVFTIDSAFVRQNEIAFPWKSNYEPGMYQVYSGTNRFSFLATDDVVRMKTYWPGLQDSLKVVQSVENEIWATYLEKKENTYKNLDLLNPILNWYDKESEFYQLALKEFDEQQKAITLWMANQQNKGSKNSLALRYIHADLKPALPLELSLKEQQAYFKQHWFDGVDWYDNDLIHSDILTNKITEHLGLYADRNMDKAMLQLAFKYAVDQVIPLTQNNNEMYAFVLDYLVRGFERYNFEEVILHIALNYPPPSEQCENEERKSEALARLEKYESMQIGQKAPDIILPNLKGEKITLSENTKEKILLVFWASWCPHCKQLIPQIQNWYQGKGKPTPDGNVTQIKDHWQVYTISLDTDKTALENFLRSNNIQLETLCNYKGWDTQAAIDYNIYATPTMIVLDANQVILSKPVLVQELEKELF